MTTMTTMADDDGTIWKRFNSLFCFCFLVVVVVVNVVDFYSFFKFFFYIYKNTHNLGKRV